MSLWYIRPEIRGMTEVVGKAGLNSESLYKALAGKGNPRLSTGQQGIKALGCLFAAIPIVESIKSILLLPICNKLLRRYCTYGFLSTV
jgi:hypothetical protein